MSNKCSIDYEKLAHAIVKAQQISKEKAERDEKKEQAKHKCEWYKTIGYTELKGNEKILSRLGVEISNFFVIIKTFLFYKKEYAKTDNMTFSLLQMATSGILEIIKLLFYVIGILFIVALATAIKDEIATMGIWIGYILLSFLTFVLGKMFKIASFEVENMTDRNLLISIFSAMTSFIAMMLAIFALFVK